MPTVTTPTNCFKGRAEAMAYYRTQGNETATAKELSELVEQKCRERAISIGPPIVKAGYTLGTTDGGFRYTLTHEEFRCIAAIDSYLRETTTAHKAGDIIGFWSTGEPVKIVGRFRGKSDYGFTGIRWTSTANNGKGPFAKGLALYSQPLPSWAESLPVVK